MDEAKKMNGTRRTDHNCHGVALDVFMKFATRFRWRECRDFWPDDYTKPKIDTMKIDYSFLSADAETGRGEDTETGKGYDDLVYGNKKRRSKWAARHLNGHCKDRCDWWTNDAPLTFEQLIRACGKCGRQQRWDREIKEWLNSW